VTDVGARYYRGRRTSGRSGVPPTSGRQESNVSKQQGGADTGVSTIVRGMRSTVGRESTTFGFSILVTVTFGLLQAMEGSPDAPRIFLYAVGAVMSFTLLEGILSGGFRRPMPQHPTRTLALGTSLNVVSVLVGMAAALLLAEWMSHIALWALAPFVAGIGYLVTESIEAAVAERVLVSAGHPDAEETSG
jgi:hypothetical protein